MTRPVVLITGGAKRVGAAIVRAFADAGWHVAIHFGRSGDAARTLAASLPSAETVQCDLANHEAVLAMVADIAARHEDWRALVNSASVFDDDSVTALAPAVFDKAMAVNARAPAVLAQAFLARSRSRATRAVIQVTDQKLANPNPDFFSYTMSKHALDATIAMLAKAHRAHGSRIYGLAPGAILESHDQDAAEAEVSHRLNLLKRRTGAEEVGQGAVFLAEGHLATGQTLFIDSGQHLLDQDRDVIYLARAGETP